MSKADLKIIKDGYNYFLGRPSLLKNLKPSVSKELKYFQELDEKQKDTYVQNSIINRAALVAAGAVAAALVAREIAPIAREIVAEREVNRGSPNFSCEPEVDDTYFDPKPDSALSGPERGLDDIANVHYAGDLPPIKFSTPLMSHPV